MAWPAPLGSVIPKPDVIPYLVAHMHRSFEAAAATVERLDRAALAEARTVSRRLAARILAETGDRGDDTA